MYFGVQGKWLLESNSYMKNVIIVMGGIYYIVNIFQSSINYVNSEIDKRMESNNTQKEILYLKEKR